MPMGEERSMTLVKEQEAQCRASSVREKDKKQTMVVSRSVYIRMVTEGHRAQKAGCRNRRASLAVLGMRWTLEVGGHSCTVVSRA